MKTNVTSPRLAAPKQSEGGSITIVFIALLAIMLLLVTAESRALVNLRREVKLLEQQQQKKFTLPPVNAIVSTNTASK